MAKRSRRKIRPMRPSLACRVDKKVYDACVVLSDKREEYISYILEDALEHYLMHLGILEHNWKVNKNE